MAIEFKLPELGENIESGDLVRVMVSSGDTVTEGQAVLELETDKAVIEVPSTVHGKVQEVRVKQGEKLRVGQVIFTVEGDGQKTAAPEQKAAAPKPEQPAQQKPKEEQPKVQEKPAASAQPAPPATAGAAVDYKLPELGENIEQGDLVRVLVKPGDTIADGTPLIELETDKAVVEVPSSVAGVVNSVNVKPGQKLKVGAVILTYTPAASSAPAASPTAPASTPEPARSEPASSDDDSSSTSIAREIHQAARRSEGKTEEQSMPPDPHKGHDRETYPQQLEKHAGADHRPPVAASPSVRRFARELGLDIYEVPGTGPGGRISDNDVKTFAKSRLAAAASAVAQAPGIGISKVTKLPDFSKWGAIEKVSLRGVRRKTAEHLAEAWVTIPHVTQHDKADISELEGLRKRFAERAEQAGGKMTITAIALKVVASALKVFPQFNATIDMANEEIIYKRYINIGVAVDTDRGLLVPVIRDVDKKNIVELAAEMTQLSLKARNKKLTPEEMEGGTFTITNLGGIGGTAFTPIVNLPEVAILGMSRSRIEPCWTKDKFEPRLTLPLSLSYDHRIIDGADAARFLRWIVEALEQPFLLSVQG